MPNKEKEPEPLAKIMSSDPRYFEINLLQEGIIDAAQALLAKESVLTHPSEKIQQFVAGRRTDLPTTPEAELLGYVTGLKQRQTTLLQMNPKDYTPNPDIQLLQGIVSGAIRLEGTAGEVDASESTSDPQSTETMALVKVEEASGETNEAGAWPVSRDDDEWDRLFSASVFASLEFDFGKSIV